MCSSSTTPSSWNTSSSTWASSSCPRTWTRLWWTSACSPTPALASTMPIRSSTSLMDIWSKVLTTVPHLPSTIRNSWPGPALHIMPLPLVGGTIWTGMGPQEEARLLMPTTGFPPQPRSMPGEVGTQCQDGRVARPCRTEKGYKDLTHHPVLRRPGPGL